MHWGETQNTPPAWLDIVRQQVGAVRFGVVQIVIHEGQVVQIERTEKVRLPARGSNAPPLPAAASALTER